MFVDEDFASAALRHARDSANLLDAGAGNSRDQAWHLAGFAHECARKACLELGWVPKILGHAFSTSADQIIEIAIALDPRASRFPLSNWGVRHPIVAAWDPAHRYERTGTAAKRDVEAIVASARSAADDVMVALFLDGSLTAESLR